MDTDDGVVLAIQAKRSINLSSGDSSELAKTTAQFVQQHLTPGHEHDRLVLVTTSEASGAVRTDLRKVLTRIRCAAVGTNVNDLALSKAQRTAYDKYIKHVGNSWERQRGTIPAPAELENFLRKCHVWVLDVEKGMPGEREALDRLRTMVILDPDYATAAWEVLLGECAELAIAQMGTDRERLQASLAASGIALVTMRDFTADVKRLSRWTHETLEQLEGGLTTIPTPNGPVAIQRGQVAELVSRSQQESFLVEGDPGSGKTVILHQLARAGVAAGRPVFFTAVGGLAATSSGSLQAELGLEHPLLDALAQWSPDSSGLLLIDALDAARADSMAGLWYSIISEVQRRLPRWQVIASIRTWDLQHSKRWRTLFPAMPARAENLSDQELNQAGTAFPALADLLADSTTAQRQLLRNAFNLRLAAELLMEGISASELVGVGSRLDLLDRYWHIRVIDGEGGFARAAVLGRLCAIAASERRLSVSTLRLLEGDIAAEEAVRDLLSNSVLASGPGVAAGAGLGPVQFTHHVLFDYALAVTHFASFSHQSFGEGLVGSLSADPDLVLFARPSIGIFLQLAWGQGPEEFCTLAVQLAAPQLPSMAATAVADVVVRSIRSSIELEPLLASIIEGSQEARRIATAMAVAVSLAIKDGTLINQATWAKVAERLSLKAEAAGPALGILVTNLTADALTASALASCGLAARRLLEYLWTQRSSAPTRLVIRAVIATASSDQEAAYVLLRQALEPGQLQERGHNDLLALADDVPQLIRQLPKLIPELYVAAMSYEEESTEPTQLGSGAVLSLQSTRRQDFDSSKYQLVESFSEVLRWDIGQAVEILTALSCHGLTDSPVHQVVLAGATAEILLDDSRLWEDTTSHTGKDLVALLDAFLGHTTVADLEATQALIQFATSAPQAACVWRRILKASAENPTVYQIVFPEPASVLAGLLVPDLLGPASALLHKVHKTSDRNGRAVLEEKILALKPLQPEDDSTDGHTVPSHYSICLEALSPAHIITPTLRTDRSARLYVQEDHGCKVVPHEEVPKGAQSTEDDGTESRARILIAQLEEFAATNLNNTPSTADISACESTVSALQDILTEVGDQVRADAEDVLAHVAEIWTRNAQAPAEALTRARDILLGLAASPRPRPTADNANFDMLIPAGARGYAARGLLQASRVSNLYTPLVADALRSLAEDPVGWVRYNIANGTWMLRVSDPSTAWDLLNRLATRGGDEAVHSAVVRSACLQMGDPQRGIELLLHLIEQVTPSKHRHSAAETCATIASLLWVHRGMPGADTALDYMIRSWLGQNSWSSCLHELRTSGSFADADESVRQRLFDLLTSLAGPALADVQHFSSLQAPLTPTELDHLKRELRLLDTITFQLYLAIGANKHADQLPSREQIRLIDEANPLLQTLAATPVASVVHRLVEIYDHVLDCRPEQALLAVRDILLQVGTQSGYTGDTLGIAICVRFVERVLADHRSILREPDNLTALREVCDTFIDAGWPQAHRLVYGIEQIFR
ncbi:ATP-binding protein [Actinomadura chibensis]|uniref:ATP-binding protein n=1 Tax=Actinomadura chibensis TaxID=392828 RepID=UPI00157D3A5C|nr:ATP-binding protein [Actinomadura chibensis]